MFIILTGWNDKYNRNMPFYYKVPYSSHSNYRELECFVKAVCPRKLIFNVDDRGDDCKQRADFQQYLVKEYVSNMRHHIVNSIPTAVSQNQQVSINSHQSITTKQKGYEKAIAQMS